MLTFETFDERKFIMEFNLIRNGIKTQLRKKGLLPRSARSGVASQSDDVLEGM